MPKLLFKQAKYCGMPKWTALKGGQLNCTFIVDEDATDADPPSYVFQPPCYKKEVPETESESIIEGDQGEVAGAEPTSDGVESSAPDQSGACAVPERKVVISPGVESADAAAEAPMERSNPEFDGLYFSISVSPTALMSAAESSAALGISASQAIESKNHLVVQGGEVVVAPRLTAIASSALKVHYDEPLSASAFQSFQLVPCAPTPRLRCPPQFHRFVGYRRRGRRQNSYGRSCAGGRD